MKDARICRHIINKKLIYYLYRKDVIYIRRLFFYARFEITGE